MPPTLLDISKKAGLAVTTVSSVLNDRPGYSQATRKRVRQVAEELGYTANPLARGLLGKSTASVALLWSMGGPHTSGEMARDIALRMQRRGYVTHLADSLSDPDVVGRLLADYRRRGVDAVVLQYQDGVVTKAIDHQLYKFPAAVVVGPFGPTEAMDWVCHDLPAGYRQAVDHFANTGRNHPAILCDSASAGYKIKAFFEQCRSRGMAVSDRSVINVSPGAHARQWIASCKQALKVQFATEFPFDALICTCDELAAAAIDWLRGRGLRVPEDVAVVGCNNAALSEAIAPPLASIERHDEKVASAIEEMIFSRLSDPELPARQKEVKGEFVWRESAGQVGIGVK